MKRKFGIAKAVMSWALMLGFFVVGVVAMQAKGVDFEGNLKFEATDVKAKVSVFQAMKNTDTFETGDFTKVGEDLTFDENNQTQSAVVLGNEGVIEFSSSLQVYALKIVVENTFNPGGRSIEVNYNLNYLDDIDGIEAYEYNIDLPEGVEADAETGAMTIAPNQVITFVFVVQLNADQADSIDTTLDSNFELVSISLLRVWYLVLNTSY